MRAGLHLVVLLCLGTSAVASPVTPGKLTDAGGLAVAYLGLGHTGEITTAAWSPDGRTIATGSEDGTVVLWDRATWGPRATFAGYTAAIALVAWCPSGNRLVSADSEHAAIVWDTVTGTPCITLTGHTGRLQRLSWSPDRMTIAGSDRQVIQWRQGGRLWPLAKFRRRFERPDLVRRAIGGEAVRAKSDLLPRRHGAVCRQ
jgi:WD40 repeat protein